jgi:hypothetical protein
MLRNRRGHALFAVVMLMLGIGSASVAVFYYHSLTTRSLLARNETQAADFAAEGAVRVMVSRVQARAEERLGFLQQADLDEFQADLAAIPMPAGLEIDTDHSHVRAARVTNFERLPMGVSPMVVTPAQPRGSFAHATLPDGMLAAFTVDLEITVTVKSHAGRRSAHTFLAVSKVPPYQYAVQTDGAGEICVSNPSGTAAVTGTLLLRGELYARCSGQIDIAGEVQAEREMVVSGSAPRIILAHGTSRSLGSLRRENMEGQTQLSLESFGGRVRLLDALGGTLARTAFQDATFAGSGECQAFDNPCGGTGYQGHSIRLRRAQGLTGSQFEVKCGPAYPEQRCGEALQGVVTYTENPFTGAASARPDPADPNRLWSGLLADFRREARCTATVGARSFRTYRCTSNAFGYSVDLGALPPIRGGLLAFRRAEGADAAKNPSGFQEVVVLRNARSLQGPLTIHSEIPVYLVCSFNDFSRVPAMIDAPLITVLPCDFDAQRQTAMVWDSVGTPQNLVAKDPVEIVAVLRSDYHNTAGGGLYYGGVLEQIPSVLGNWGQVALKVTGAVEGRLRDPALPGSYAQAFRAYNAMAQNAVTQPRRRVVEYDPQLLDLRRQPPGSWLPENMPASGAAFRYTAQRQALSYGSFSVVRQTRHIRRGLAGPGGSAGLPSVTPEPRLVLSPTSWSLQPGQSRIQEYQITNEAAQALRICHVRELRGQDNAPGGSAAQVFVAQPAGAPACENFAAGQTKTFQWSFQISFTATPGQVARLGIKAYREASPATGRDGSAPVTVAALNNTAPTASVTCDASTLHMGGTALCTLTGADADGHTLVASAGWSPAGPNRWTRPVVLNQASTAVVPVSGTVTDPYGATGTAAPFNVTFTNTPPTASGPVCPPTVQPGQSYQCTASGNDADAHDRASLSPSWGAWTATFTARGTPGTEQRCIVVTDPHGAQNAPPACATVVVGTPPATTYRCYLYPTDQAHAAPSLLTEAGVVLEVNPDPNDLSLTIHYAAEPNYAMDDDANKNAPQIYAYPAGYYGNLAANAPGARSWATKEGNAPWTPSIAGEVAAGTELRPGQNGQPGTRLRIDLPLPPDRATTWALKYEVDLRRYSGRSMGAMASYPITVNGTCQLE